ncbi:diaminopimelate decarboxylase, partial [Streptomyces parvus]
MTQTTSAPHHGHGTAPPAARFDAVVEAAVPHGLLGEGVPVAGVNET